MSCWQRPTWNNGRVSTWTTRSTANVESERHEMEADAAANTLAMLMRAVAISGRPANPTTQRQVVVFAAREQFHRDRAAELRRGELT